MDRRGHVYRTPTRVVIACVASFCMLFALSTPAAQALNVTTPTITLSDPTAGATSTYTLSSYRVVGNENATGAQITFPAGFDLSNATLVSPPGTLSRSGQTLTLTFTPKLEKNTDFSVVLGSIGNPPDEGTYTMPGMTVYLISANKGEPMPPASVAVGTATIGVATLSVTISTTVVNFELSPESPAAPQNVSLAIDSSLPYTVSRTISGDDALFGLSVTGQAQGSKAAGSATLTDVYEADVPWTTEADITYSAQVVYTIVQQ